MSNLKYVLNWILPFVLFSYIILSYFIYVFEFCYVNLILKERNFDLSFCYLYIYNLIFFLVIWSFASILIQNQPNIMDKYNLNNNFLKNLKVKSETIDEYYTRIHVDKNEQLEIYARKLNLNLITRNSVGQIGLCLTCKIIKPDRCYHCKKCCKCILKRDHHCPWFNNCIGYVNQKTFILFLIYLTIFTSFSIVTTLKYFITNFVNLINNQNYDLIIIGYFILNAFILIPILLLTLNTLFLALINETNIEHKYPPRLFKAFNRGDISNPFDLNSKLSNLTQIFGSNLLTAFLPISTSPGDGHLFKSLV